ncbi:MAG: RidA family protein [Thermomonas sp.]
MIQRFDCGPRMSEMTIHNGVAYLAGQIPEDTSVGIVGQTEQVLKAIDDLLKLAAIDKTNILRAEIFLADMADFDGMNEAWDKWVAHGATPARATVQARLANSEWKIEIVVTAAVQTETNAR